MRNPVKQTLPLLGIFALLLTACEVSNPDRGGKSPIVSITKSYTFSCNADLKTLSDVYVVYVGADGKPSAPEKVSGQSWERSDIEVPVKTKATAVEGSTAGISVICNPNPVPDNGEYDVQYEMNCVYTITREDGTTTNLPAWHINPQMPAVEGRTAGETCNAVSLSCTNDTQIVCDDQGNAYLADSNYWQEEEGEYVPIDPEKIYTVSSNNYILMNKGDARPIRSSIPPVILKMSSARTETASAEPAATLPTAPGEPSGEYRQKPNGRPLQPTATPPKSK